MMRIVVAVCIVSCLFYSYSEAARVKNDFVSDDPNINFTFITFDQLHRGTFRMSYCSSELINCWEIIKADQICQYKKHYESVCGTMRDYCDDVEGDSQDYGHFYELREMYCNEGFGWNGEVYTRRSNSERLEIVRENRRLREEYWPQKGANVTLQLNANYTYTRLEGPPLPIPAVFQQMLDKQSNI